MSEENQEESFAQFVNREEENVGLILQAVQDIIYEVSQLKSIRLEEQGIKIEFCENWTNRYGEIYKQEEHNILIDWESVKDGNTPHTIQKAIEQKRQETERIKKEKEQALERERLRKMEEARKNPIRSEDMETYLRVKESIEKGFNR